MIDNPLVSIIIPVYNKGATVARAIDSAFAQTYKNIEVIVVDDGSTDNSSRASEEALERNGNGWYIYQENAGVAIARNLGVLEYSKGELIVCLDSDDELGPRYLELLVPNLWKDFDLGIVYTTLLNINVDGSKKVSKWPSKFDAHAHFFGRFNQVPTAALARRQVWERLGGQRQRYAPDGAGAEDGDFWLRAGAYGFGIKYIHPAYGEDSMFHYSTQQGLVSGNRDYTPVNWRLWSPWTERKDLMPVASIAPATNFSHPARRYDEPIVSVIIPVGPRHSKYLIDSLDSLDAQTLKKWEAIVIFDISTEEWSELSESGELDYISTTWPFCRFTSTNADGKFARELTDTLDVVAGRASLLAGLPAGKPRGAGAARNIGIHAARGSLLIFLDADDYFMPTALEKMVQLYAREKKIIFADHYGVAPIEKDKLSLVHGKVVSYNEKNGLAVIEQGVANYDCQKASEQPYTDGRLPYIICNVSSLIPRKWALELGGFPEKLSSWEDVLFWWMASWKGYCFAKVHEPLLVYRYHTGFRRELGRENARSLLQYIKKIREEFADMGCGCGDSPGEGVIIDSYGNVQQKGVTMATLDLSKGSQLAVNDGDLVLVVFEPMDRGDKLRYGQHDFGGGNFIKYGRKSGGEQMFVHRNDIDADANIAMVHNRPPMYRVVDLPPVEEPGPVKELEPPKEILEAVFAEPEPPAEVLEEVFADMEATDAYFPEPVEGAYPARLTPLEDLDVGDLRNPSKYIEFMKAENIDNAFQIVRWNEAHDDGLTEIKGIGPKAAKRFTDAAAALV